MKHWYAIKALATGSTDTAEVSILDEIGGMFGVSAKQFIADFRAIEAPNVKLFINSPGGSVFEGLAMFNAMVASGKNIEVHILGIAASMASYLAMVGGKVVMPANTMMFIHNPISGVRGNAADMRESADILDKVGASLTATYAKRFTGEAAVLDALLAAESYLTAAECLAYGLCDEVTAEIPVTAAWDVSEAPAAVQALFKPKAVKPAVAPSLADDVAGLAKDAGLEAFIDVFVTDPGVTSLETAAAAVQTAKDIKAIATHAKLPDQAEALIRARKTLPEARAALADQLAAVDALTRVDTTRKSVDMQAKPAASYSPQSLWAEIHASTGKNRSKK